MNNYEQELNTLNSKLWISSNLQSIIYNLVFLSTKILGHPRLKK